MQRRQRIDLEGVRREVVVLHITLQQALPFQVSADALRQAVDQLRELFARRGRYTVKAQTAVGALGVDAVEEQPVPMNIQVQCAAEALHLRDRAGAGRLVRKSRFADQVRGNGAVHDGQHAAHDVGAAGKQKA